MLRILSCPFERSQIRGCRICREWSIDRCLDWSIESFLTTASASFVAWSEAKRFDELQESYKLDETELAFAEAVVNGENATSRERTMWAAKSRSVYSSLRHLLRKCFMQVINKFKGLALFPTASDPVWLSK